MQAKRILELAKSAQPADREQLLLSLVDLCEQDAGAEAGANPAIQALMTSVFMSLVADTERQIRGALAGRIAAAPWAPRGLINVLALDEIEIARPIISQSPVLQDEDLVRIIALATLEHQVVVAGRPAIGRPVIERLLQSVDPQVLTALAANDTADIHADGMAALLAASQKIVSIRSPLARHPRLTPDMAKEMYAWVGQSLRAAIVSRFRVDPEELDKAIAHAVNDSQTGAPAPAPAYAAVATGEQERAEMEARLVEKLHASGQLRPGFLVKALRDQRLSLFVAGLAQRIEVDRSVIQRAIDSDRPQLLALACISAGIDRSAYDTVLRLVRDLNRGRPSGGEEAGRKALGLFAMGDLSQARSALQRAAG